MVFLGLLMIALVAGAGWVAFVREFLRARAADQEVRHARARLARAEENAAVIEAGLRYQRQAAAEAARQAEAAARQAAHWQGTAQQSVKVIRYLSAQLRGRARRPQSAPPPAIGGGSRQE